MGYYVDGSVTPAGAKLGTLTEGLGFDLVTVDTAAGRSTGVDVSTEYVFMGQSDSDQQPAATNEVMQVRFGPADATSAFDLAADGTLTCLQAGNYNIYSRLLVGRTGGSTGAADIFIRATMNGVQTGPTVFAKVAGTDFVFPAIFNYHLDMNAGDALVVELIRGSSGANEGGILRQSPTLAGWGEVPSAYIAISQTTGTLI